MCFSMMIRGWFEIIPPCYCDCTTLLLQGRPSAPLGRAEQERHTKLRRLLALEASYVSGTNIQTTLLDDVTLQIVRAMMIHFKASGHNRLGKPWHNMPVCLLHRARGDLRRSFHRSWAFSAVSPFEPSAGQFGWKVHTWPVHLPPRSGRPWCLRSG